MPQTQTEITQYKTIWNIRAYAESKGVENPYQLHKICSSITSPRAIKFWNGLGKLSTEDIDDICNGLDCEPKDLIIRINLESEKTDDSKEK